MVTALSCFISFYHNSLFDLASILFITLQISFIMSDPINLEAFQAQVTAKVILEMEKKQEAERRSELELSRKLRIDQEKSKFRQPADKRAVGFLMEMQFDMKDFLQSFSKLFTEGEEMKPIATNVEAVEAFVKKCSGFGNKMNRKLARELEAYNVANTSRYGWGAEKFYRQEDLFSKVGVTEDKSNWYEKDEISPEEKVKKLRNAERQVALNNKQKKSSSSSKFEQRGGRKRTRWGLPAESSTSSTPSSSTASAQQLIPQQQLYQPPVRAGPKCFACGQFGHIQLYCPMKNIKKE